MPQYPFTRVNESVYSLLTTQTFSNVLESLLFVFGCDAEQSFTSLGHMNHSGSFSTQIELWIIITLHHTLCQHGSFSVLVGKILILLLSAWPISKHQRPITVICHVGRWEQLKKDGYWNKRKWSKNVTFYTNFHLMRSRLVCEPLFSGSLFKISLCAFVCTCVFLIQYASSISLASLPLHLPIVRWVNGCHHRACRVPGWMLTLSF